MTRSERQFNAFVEAAQNQGENEEAAATLGALIRRMLSHRADQSARERSAEPVSEQGRHSPMRVNRSGASEENRPEAGLANAPMAL